MPWAAKQPCLSPGCAELVTKGRCPKHTVQRAQEVKRESAAYDRRRGSPESRGYDKEWGAFSKAWRAAHPLCAECERRGRVTAAECVDHVTRWQSGVTPEEQRRLKYSHGNVESLCWSCHSRKTAQRDGSLGNPRR